MNQRNTTALQAATALEEVITIIAGGSEHRGSGQVSGRKHLSIAIR